MNIFYSIIIILVLIVFCFYFYRKKSKNIESFDPSYQINKGNDFQDDRFEIYNQNSGKAWKEPVNAYNAPIVQEYGTSFNDMYKMNEYIFNDFEKKDLDKFIKKYSQDIDINKDEYLVSFTPFDLANLNKNTWYNRYSWNPDYTLFQKYVPSKFEEVNQINKLFLLLFNEYWFNFLLLYPKSQTILQKPYFMLKYRIVNIYRSKINTNNEVSSASDVTVNDIPKYRIFEVVVTIARDDAMLAFEFFLKGLYEYIGNQYELQKLNISYISNYSLDKLLIRKGIDKNNNYYNLNPIWENDTSLTSKMVENIYEDRKKKVFQDFNFLDFTYACYTYEKGAPNPEQIPIFATDKNDCENQYTIMGIKKPSGVWDRPCQKDSECMYFKSNKNYENTFGRCINGKCELPINMKPLGYHYFIDEKSGVPMCYNCDSKEWLPNTKIGKCCDAQKDKTKYPFLKSPDYAFKGDSRNRFNQYILKNCKMKPSFSNIFKPTNLWKVDCKGFLDSYVIDNSK